MVKYDCIAMIILLRCYYCSILFDLVVRNPPPIFVLVFVVTFPYSLQDTSDLIGSLPIKTDTCHEKVLTHDLGNLRIDLVLSKKKHHSEKLRQISPFP